MNLYNSDGELVGYYPEAVGLPRSNVRDARKAERRGGRDERQGRAMDRILGDRATPSEVDQAARNGYLIPSSERRLSLPLGSATAVAAAASTVLTINVQKPFQAERLILSSADLPGWVVTDVKIGTRSQFASSGDCPAEAFAANAVFAGFAMDPASPGILVEVFLRNDNTAASAISGMLYGQSIS